uniref:sulfate ABC transporter protein n=1 Tax=Galdieria phlegrea TaxID=1389228 RepID=UPI0023D7D9B4|nr:sulfate ABC transporter protein [Galdieria phlegrea]UNJ16167.1 iron-sulfur cluster formation ABC transporter ATP-binding subunit [Galdieria sp.]WDA99591.1 sulfate ABC transporter protein [Galdieria sulphuraria]WDA99781.1 sulfate ABC transporter protein [Galdieria phlegrea]
MKHNSLLEIKNLHVKLANTEEYILNGIDLNVKQGEIHAIMGPNGSGKSTLSKVIAGHNLYKVVKGEILFQEQNLLNFNIEDRANLGIFLAFQYPLEISGVNNIDFLRFAYNSKLKFNQISPVDPLKFLEIVYPKLKLVGLDESFLYRKVNEGFSGGEKKKNEILQMALLDAKLAILDETDSGLDIDSLKDISNAIKSILEMSKFQQSIIIITHYQRILNYIKPDYIHVMHKGKIIKTGDASLANELEAKGYEWIANE